MCQWFLHISSVYNPRKVKWQIRLMKNKISAVNFAANICEENSFQTAVSCYLERDHHPPLFFAAYLSYLSPTYRLLFLSPLITCVVFFFFVLQDLPWGRADQGSQETLSKTWHVSENDWSWSCCTYNWGKWQEGSDQTQIHAVERDY